MDLAKVIISSRCLCLRTIGGGLYNISIRSWNTSTRLELRGRTRKPQIHDHSAHGSCQESMCEKVEKFEITEGSNYGNARNQLQSSGQVRSVGVKESIDHQYFKKLTANALVASKSELQSIGTKCQTGTGHTVKVLIQSNDIISQVTKGKSLENILKSSMAVKPALPKKSFNLAAFVSESETLSNLVKLGVDLTKIEQDVKVANLITKLDFVKDIQPYLSFLHRNGVKDDDLGVCITKSPKIFLQSLEDLEVRINYLKSKKFNVESIGAILTKSPGVVLLSTKEIDTRLGFLQKLFSLSGDEVRLVVTHFPKIALWDSTSIKDMKMTLSDFLGFQNSELKQLLILCPRLYVSDKNAIKKRFDYIHNVIGYSHQDISSWPSVLRTRLSIIKPRHLFLKHLGRDQFDPKKENYISLKALALGRDIEFCENFAKVPIQQFNDFLKTL